MFTSKKLHCTISLKCFIYFGKNHELLEIKSSWGFNYVNDIISFWTLKSLYINFWFDQTFDDIIYEFKLLDQSNELKFKNSVKISLVFNISMSKLKPYKIKDF